MTSPHNPALLAAVRATPLDNLPRLVYADWLDETGDDPAALRAEFIRVSCKGKTDKNAAGTKAWLSSHARLARLLAPAFEAVAQTHLTHFAGMFWRGGDIRLSIPQRDITHDPITATITFRRGFLVRASWQTVPSYLEFAHHLAAVEAIAEHHIRLGSRMTQPLHPPPGSTLVGGLRVFSQHLGNLLFDRVSTYAKPTEPERQWATFPRVPGEGTNDLLVRVARCVNAAATDLAHDRAFHDYGSPTRACALCQKEVAG